MIKRHTILGILVAGTLTGVAVAQETTDGTPLQVGNHIPTSAHIAFWVDDVGQTREQFLENPFFEMLVDEQYGVGGGTTAVARTLSRIPVSAADPLGPVWEIVLPEVGFGIATGIESATSVFHFTAQDVVDTFDGSLAMYSTLYRLYMENDVEIVEWDVILSATFEEDERDDVDAFLEDALRRVPSTATRRIVDYHGEDVYQIRYYLEEQVGLPGDPLGELDVLQEFEVIVEYAYVDGVFLLAEGRGDPLRRAIGTLKGVGGFPPLKESVRYRRASLAHGPDTGNLHFYYDLAHQIREKENLPSHQESMRFFNMLGLLDAGPVRADFLLDGEEARINLSIASPERSSGIFELLQEFPENRRESLRYVPGDAKTFGTLTLDLKKTYDYFVNVYQEVVPSAAIGIRLALSSIENQFQIKVVDDLFTRVNGEMLTYMRESVDPVSGMGTEVSTGWYLPFNGSGETVAQVNQAVRTLSEGEIRLIDAEESDVDGVTLWSLQSPQGRQLGAPPISFAVSPAGVVAGDTPAEARDLLRRLQGGGGEDIRSNAKVSTILETIDGENLIGFVYTNGEALVDEILRATGGNPSLRTPPEDMLRRALGDSWWTLRQSDEGLNFSFTISAP